MAGPSQTKDSAVGTKVGSEPNCSISMFTKQPFSGPSGSGSRVSPPGYRMTSTVFGRGERGPRAGRVPRSSARIIARAVNDNVAQSRA